MKRFAGSQGRFLLAVFCSALVAATAIVRREPPTPKPIQAPASQFSASRAREVLRRLVGDDAPHPVGSAAHEIMRRRVIDEIARLGYVPSVQRTFVCGRSGACATVENVLARQPKTGSGRAVLLCAHYDSVGAGPGASDDGMGVAAVIEIARVVAGEPSAKNPIIFLIDDGEEAGLLGAEAFAASHPWAREIGAVVNLENRGTSGASFLFETSDDNRWLVDLAAGEISRPATSSLFYTVYKSLPNDTDLTVFRAHGMAGVNFAAIGDEPRYHTPLDNFENASAATLQHHGDSALAMVRALSRCDLSAPHRGNAVFFDLFGAGIVRWPQSATPWLAAAALVLLAGRALLAWRRGALAARALVWGLLGAVAMPLPAAILGLGASRFLIAIGRLPVGWIAHPAGLLVAAWMMGLFCPVLVSALLSRRAGSEGLWNGVWILYACAATWLAWKAPGISFLFLVPAVAAALLGLLSWRAREPTLAAYVVPACAAAYFWLPTAWLLYAALGRASTTVIASAVSLWTATLTPPLAQVSPTRRRQLLGVIAGMACLGLFVAAGARPFSPAVPERMTITWLEDSDAGRAAWLLQPESNRLSASTREASGCSAQPIRAFPWSGTSRTFSTPEFRGDLPGPQLLVTQDFKTGSQRHVHARLQSPRGATTAFLAWPSSETLVVSMGGVPAGRFDPRLLAARDGWRVISCLTLGPEGVDVEISRSGPEEAIDLFLGDRSAGLPSGGERLVRARGALGVASHGGDSTIVTRRLRL